jgi:hypothetical protein
MYRYFKTPRLIGLPSLGLILWALAALSPAWAANPPSAAVGKATMVIGLAYLVSDGGEVSAMDRGAVVRVGDRIETSANGHVHLRFADGGLVSVRPESRLQIQKYSYNQGQPEAGGIKFKLEQGVVRSITGAWGEAARERFRLNTPLAAIGVKGTDFVVSANATTTLASVYAGAIVMAPLLGDCQATLGPCVTGAERLLTQDMKGQMVSLVGAQGTPQLVASTDVMGRQLAVAEPTVRNDAPVKSSGQSGAAGANAGASASVSANNSSASSSSSNVIAPLLGDRSTGVAYADVQSASSLGGQIARAAAAPEAKPPVILPPEVKQLVWANMLAMAQLGDTISKSYADVAKMKGYQGTVGNFEYGLYRDASNASTGMLNAAEPSANFRLAGGAAQVLSTDIRGVTSTEVANINSGTLSVDFAKSTFATQLQVQVPKLGQETVSSTGVVQSNGVFRGGNDTTFLAGALSLNGTEAGYFFEKTIASGQLRGITLWGR